jgi:SIR2-like domain
LATTNYDLVVERAYEANPNRVQNMVPVTRDGDGSDQRIDRKTIPYVKLHGCITRANETHPPLIASTEQLIAFREGRQGQFTTFLEWAKTKTMIFVGYSFKDPNLRQLLDEIIREGDNRPRHYVIDPNVLPAIATYWSDRRIAAISMSFGDFLTQLDAEVPRSARSLSALAASAPQASHFTKFINKATHPESAELQMYLASSVDFVFKELDAKQSNPHAFYRGFNQGWAAIQDNLDVRQAVIDDVLSEEIIPPPKTGTSTLAIIKGHAGSGKTVALRRIAWDAAKRFDRLAVFVTREHAIDIDRFKEIFSLTDTLTCGDFHPASFPSADRHTSTRSG